MPSFVAFLDLVGMRDLATQHAGGEEFLRVLHGFHTQLCKHVHLLAPTPRSSMSKSDRIFFFSDCAFVQSSNLRRLLSFLREVRLDLMAKGIYFKAAVRAGHLEAKGLSELLADQTELIQLYGSQIQGSYFGAAAAEAYRDQDRLKGIGATIEAQIVGDLLGTPRSTTAGEPAVVTSCFVSSPPARSYTLFYDLSYHKRTTEGFNGLLSSAMNANGQSRSFSRYYVSPIVSWIQSAEIEFDSESSDLPVDPAHRAVLSGKLERALSGVAGIEIPYFALVAKAFSQERRSAATNDQFDYVRRMLAKQFNSRRRSRLSLIPVGLLNLEARRRFNQEVASVT